MRIVAPGVARAVDRRAPGSRLARRLPRESGVAMETKTQLLVLTVLFLVLAGLAGVGAWVSYQRLLTGLRWPVHVFSGVAVVWLICTAILIGMILGRYYLRLR